MLLALVFECGNPQFCLELPMKVGTESGPLSMNAAFGIAAAYATPLSGCTGDNRQARMPHSLTHCRKQNRRSPNRNVRHVRPSTTILTQPYRRDLLVAVTTKASQKKGPAELRPAIAGNMWKQLQTYSRLERGGPWLQGLPYTRSPQLGLLLVLLVLLVLILLILLALPSVCLRTSEQ